MGAEHGELDGVVVIDASVGLAGTYCSKMLTDAGATVTRFEPPAGDPQRHQQWSGEPTETDAPLFRFLRHGQRSITAGHFPNGLDGAALDELCASADLLIVSGSHPFGPADRLAERVGGTVVLSITAYGTTGPYADLAATEFTIQADSGALAIRGTRELPPFQMGGRIIEWVSGAYGAVAALAAIRRARSIGFGEFIDLSMFEVANITGTNFSDLFNSLAGRPEPDPAVPPRSVEIPSIEPTQDGWVGFNTNTRDQWESFCLLIERPDLIETAEFALLAARTARAEEWNALVREWTIRHTTADIVERAAQLRIPVAPVSDGRSLLELDHPRERGVFIADPTGEFMMPRRPYRFDGEPIAPPRPAPTLGAHDGAPLPQRTERSSWSSEEPPLPLAGIRVLDLTAWWAGPSAAAILAALGAEVVHVESTRRIDGMRTAGGMFYSRPQWWEYSAFFLQANTNKLGITLDLDDERGRAMALELAASADIVIENFTPRVIEAFDLGWDVVREANPQAIFVRMPAFGLDGPWRDRPGFAQTMEQITGLAWMTGYPEDQPRIQRGPCDPNGGLHAAFAALVALERRDRTGSGCLVEAPMFEAALNVAAEPVLEWSAHRMLVGREGNRSPYAAPQNLYACAGTEQWVALSCGSDDDWRALATVIGRPDLRDDPALGDLVGRRARHDRLDGIIGAWCSERSPEQVVQAMRAAGVPAAPATDCRRTAEHPQVVARNYTEPIEHPVVGTHPVPGLPFRYGSIDHWIRRPAPVLGQDNLEVLGGWLGRSEAELEELERQGVIGTWPVGA